MHLLEMYQHEQIKNITEAKNGELVLPGRVYIAPGDYHMTIENKGTEVPIKLNQNPSENYCRPNANPMLESITKMYGAKVCSVVPTGMASDWINDCRCIVAAGGQVFAQDFETSVVCGILGVVFDASLCSKVLPLI